MKKKIILGLIVILNLLPSFGVLAADLSREITDGNDDVFMVESGNMFIDTDILTLKDPLQGIFVGLRFQNIPISKHAPITYANLTVMVPSDLIYDHNSFVTIYGIDENDCEPFSGHGDLSSRALTDSYTIWNVSNLVNGSAKYTVDVTNIVREITMRYNWENGNDLGFIIMAVSGWNKRTFIAYEGTFGDPAQLDIRYNVQPENPQEDAPPPYNDDDLYVWVWWKHYKCYDIWNVTNIGDCGSGRDLDWGNLNLTDLTILDSGGDYNQVNDTYLQRTTMRASAIAAYYNDTGSANIVDGFFRFRSRITGVLCTEVSDAPVFMYCGISSATPVGGGGLPYGATGTGAWLMVIADEADVNWRYFLRIKNGLLDDIGGYSNWYQDTSPANHWITCWFDSEKHRITYRVYDDPQFSNQIDGGQLENSWFTGFYRYPQIFGSCSQAHNSWGSDWSLTYLTYGCDTVLHFISRNETVYPDPYDDPEEIIDDWEGDEYEDPQEDDWGIISKFQFKLLWMIIGLIMLIGSPLFGINQRVSVATWITILFVMLIGISMLWGLPHM